MTVIILLHKSQEFGFSTSALISILLLYPLLLYPWFTVVHIVYYSRLRISGTPWEPSQEEKILLMRNPAKPKLLFIVKMYIFYILLVSTILLLHFHIKTFYAHHNTYCIFMYCNRIKKCPTNPKYY